MSEPVLTLWMGLGYGFVMGLSLHMIVDLRSRERAEKSTKRLADRSTTAALEVGDVPITIRSNRGYNNKPLCVCGQEDQTLEEATRSASICKSVYGAGCDADVYECPEVSDGDVYHVSFDRIFDFVE